MGLDSGYTGVIMPAVRSEEGLAERVAYQKLVVYHATDGI
jgi:hypothetical protein